MCKEEAEYKIDNKSLEELIGAKNIEELVNFCNNQEQLIKELNYQLNSKEDTLVLTEGCLTNVKDENSELYNEIQKIKKSSLYLAIYDVFFEKGDVQTLMRKYKVFNDLSEAESFIHQYNTSKYTPNREIIHFEIHVANKGYKWEDIDSYHNKMVKLGKEK